MNPGLSDSRHLAMLSVTGVTQSMKHMGHKNDHMEIFPISAKTGEGVEKLADWIVEKVRQWQE